MTSRRRAARAADAAAPPWPSPSRPWPTWSRFDDLELVLPPEPPASIAEVAPVAEIAEPDDEDASPGRRRRRRTPAAAAEVVDPLPVVEPVEVLDAFLAECGSGNLAQPQDGATVVLRHTGASVRGKKLLDAVRSGQGGGVEIPCPAVKRDSDRFDFAAGEFQTAKKRIAPSALRALVSAFADDLTELAAACQQLIADVPGDIDDRIVERYYGGRVETSAFTVADTAIAGRYGDALVALRHALASGADPVPLVAAIASKLRTMARVAGNRESSAALAARLGLKDWQVDRARRDLSGWNETTLGLAIQAAARADAEVKGASRDPVFALERLVTVIATRAPYGS